jgi:hypothetical protein
VLPLTGGAGMEGLGFAVSEILARDLALVPRVRVVERARLDAVLKELGLAATGRLAPQSAPRAGQLVSAERLLSGTVARTAVGASPANASAASVSVDVALLNVQTGATQPIYTGRFPLNGLIDAQEQLAENAFTQLGVTLLPAERERLSKRPTRRVDALIAFGNGRRAEAMGNATQARQFYQQASRLDPAFVDPSGVLAPPPALPVASAPLVMPTVSPVIAPSPVAAAAPAARLPLRQPFDQLMDELASGVTDRVVRRASPPALCPPTCPALAAASGTVTVRITP